MLFCTVRAVAQLPVEDVIHDIYAQLTELEGVDYEELQMDLLDLAAHPIDLNTATESDLQRLPFLSPQQVDDILLYVYLHPLDSLYELRMIPSLQDYDIRNIRAFCYVKPRAHAEKDKIYPAEIPRQIRHEIITRIDARNIEDYTNDPVALQFRYKARYRDYAEIGLRLNRPAGEDASALQYGGYIQLQNIGPLQKLVLGNMQAHFGQGLVMASAFHTGKNMYVANVGYEQEGVRKLNAIDGSGLHGIGATMQWTHGKTRFLLSALYSLQKDRNNIRHHAIGANLTLSRNQWKIGFTAIEHIYSDTIAPYRDMAYNARYFRGTKQMVLGLNARYRWRWMDIFGEVATAQNNRWGAAAQTGARIYPLSGVEITLLHRYFSPWYDNPSGYAFSQTARVNDEHGIYLATDIRLIPGWRLSAYADLFRFEGVKYGIPFSPSYGYDAVAEALYIPDGTYSIRMRVRAREKGRKAHYSTRAIFSCQLSGWSLCSYAEANITTDTLGKRGWGISIAQDIQYRFTTVPLAIQARLQGFDARQWDNRIYRSEPDVLYSFSSTAVYGRGGKIALNIRYHILPRLSLYLCLKETIYHPSWAHARAIPLSRTDIHLMLRAKLP